MRTVRIVSKSCIYDAMGPLTGSESPGLFARAAPAGATDQGSRPQVRPANESWLTLRAATVYAVADEDDEQREDDSPREPAPGPDPEEREGRWGFSRLGEQLSGLLDPEAALRRGQGLVTGVGQATKDEAMRIISAEVRNFLDGMDIADLAQQVISGLVVDVNMQVRFSREDPDGPAQPTITRNETKIRTKREADRDATPERDDKKKK